MCLFWYSKVYYQGRVLGLGLLDNNAEFKYSVGKRAAFEGLSLISPVSRLRAPVASRKMSEKHKIFTNNPVHQRAYIHARVEVSTTDKQCHVGWVYTIDPVSESAILVDFADDGAAEVMLISGYNISDITVLEDKPPPGLSDTIDSLFRRKQVQYSSKEISERRESLCVWLAGNRVPYTIREDMSIEVLQTAVIAPPYEPGSIQCTNEVVLDKVMKLVQQMPVSSQTPGSHENC